MIELIEQNRTRAEKKFHFIHTEWAKWIEESAYTNTQARSELGLAKVTFYRRIAKAPTLIDRLAMRALYEGLEPFTTKRIEG